MIIKCGSWTWNSDLVIFQVCKISMVRSSRKCFGTIVNLKCTSRLGLASLALTNVITETLRFFSMWCKWVLQKFKAWIQVQPLMFVSIGFASQVFQIWLIHGSYQYHRSELGFISITFLSFHDLVFQYMNIFFQDLASQVLKQKGKSSPLTCPNALRQVLDLIGLGIPSLELNLTHLGNYLTFQVFKLKTWVFVARFSALAHQWS